MGAGSSVSLLTPQPNDITPDACEGEGSHSDDVGNSDYDPDCLAVRDETQQSSHSPMLVDTATDIGTPYEPLPLLGLDLVTDNYPI